MPEYMLLDLPHFAIVVITILNVPVNFPLHWRPYLLTTSCSGLLWTPRYGTVKCERYITGGSNSTSAG